MLGCERLTKMQLVLWSFSPFGFQREPSYLRSFEQKSAPFTTYIWSAQQPLNVCYEPYSSQ